MCYLCYVHVRVYNYAGAFAHIIDIRITKIIHRKNQLAFLIC